MREKTDPNCLLQHGHISTSWMDFGPQFLNAWCLMLDETQAQSRKCTARCPREGENFQEQTWTRKTGKKHMSIYRSLSLFGILTFWCRFCTDSVYFWCTSSFKQRVNFDICRKFGMVQETISVLFASFLQCRWCVCRAFCFSTLPSAVSLWLRG